MKVRYLNLAVADEKERRELLEAVEKVLLHGRIVIGPEVDEFEKECSLFCGKTYGVGVNSGSDAVHLALRSLGIGPGDEVITTCLSWVATANAISMTGARPVFVDVRNDFNIDPFKIEESITPRTKAILPVHFAGKVCDMDAIMEIANKHGLPVVEDAAQAFGATYKGKKAGSFGRVNAFSMNPMKVFAACGEAGIVLTNDEHIRDMLLALRYNGALDRMEAHFPSLNSRLDTIQAAMLLCRLRNHSASIERRRAAVAYYNCFLDGVVGTPSEYADCVDVYYLYNAICDERDRLKAFLEERGVETKINHPLLMPRQKAYRKDYGAFEWPVGESLTRTTLCLPLHANITREEQDYVIESVKLFYEKKA